MKADSPEDLRQRNRDLEARLAEAEETLRALSSGEVDAIVASSPDGDRVYTLKGADEAYRVMVEGMTEGALTLTPEGQILFSNEQFASLLRTPLERVIGSRIQNFVVAEDAELISDLLTGGSRRTAEVCLRAEGAAPVPVYLSVKHLALSGTDCLCLMVTDLSEQKRNEQIVAAERLARSILEQAAEAILVVDPEGRIMRASRAAEQLAGVPLVHHQFDDIFQLRLSSGGDCPFREILSAARQRQAVRGLEASARMPDGRQVDLLLTAGALSGHDAELLGCVINLSDITERKQSEERLREMQKLESIGMLAGGLAHDFNNLLVGVIGNASMALETIPPQSQAAEFMAGVIKAGEEMADLTRQMLAYSGKGRQYVERLNLSALIGEMTTLVRPSIPKKISLDFELARDLPPVEADRGQMQQIFMNLILNAAEAIGSHGQIFVETGVQVVDEAYLRRTPEAAGLPAGDYVYLEVRDTGRGMDPATKARIFDPFFTTKFAGRGLGLAAVGGIVRSHKGAISVTTAPGSGTCIRVLLPKGAREALPGRAADGAGSGGKLTVLVVDDEEVVRHLARSALTRHGFEVLLAGNGPEAIRILEHHPGDIALVVLDVSMPMMSGDEVLLHLRQIRPAVKVAVTSGYGEQETMELFQGQQIAGLIQKPYTSRRLLENVTLLLG